MRVFVVALALITGTGLYLGCTNSEHSDTGEFIIEFGELDGVEGQGLSFARESKRIPLRYRQDGYLFGVRITPPTNESYEVRFVHYLPAVPRDTAGKVSGAPVSQEGRVIEGSGDVSEGISVYPFGFDPGDPEGEYKVEVYLNGTRMAVLPYSVYKE